MSSGVPHRPSGIFAAMRCFTAGSSPLPYAVSIQPGPSTFTRIRGATECASARLNEYTPPFAAQNTRSEEHTSELQSPDHLVCRLLLEKKKTQNKQHQSKKHKRANRTSHTQ